MRPFVRTFLTDCVETLPLRGPVIEWGARAADGQEEIADLKALIGLQPYLGLDIEVGSGVDALGDIHRMPLADESVGTVICTEVLEHVHDPLRAVEEMHRVLRPGGVALLTSVMFMPVHNHPWDFWRFTPEGFELVLRPFETRLAFGYGMDILPEGVQGIGIKGPMTGLTLASLPRSQAMVNSWGEGRPVDFGPIRLTTAALWRRTLRETGREVKSRLRRTT